MSSLQLREHVIFSLLLIDALADRREVVSVF